MTSICMAFDNIRLLRRKIRIVEKEARDMTAGPLRDAAVAQLFDLKNDLARALQDFADLGFEEEVAAMIAPHTRQSQSMRHH